jgi:hypothetical protein
LGDKLIKFGGIIFNEIRDILHHLKSFHYLLAFVHFLAVFHDLLFLTQQIDHRWVCSRIRVIVYILLDRVILCQNGFFV